MDKEEPPLDLLLHLVKGQVILGVRFDAAGYTTRPVPDWSRHFGRAGFMLIELLVSVSWRNKLDSVNKQPPKEKGAQSLRAESDFVSSVYVALRSGLFQGKIEAKLGGPSIVSLLSLLLFKLVRCYI